MSFLPGLRSSTVFHGQSELPYTGQAWPRPALPRVSHSAVRCSDTTAPQPADTRKPSEFRRGLVIPTKLLSSGVGSLVSSLPSFYETLPSDVFSSEGFAGTAVLDQPTQHIETYREFCRLRADRDMQSFEKVEGDLSFFSCLCFRTPVRSTPCTLSAFARGMAAEVDWTPLTLAFRSASTSSRSSTPLPSTSRWLLQQGAVRRQHRPRAVHLTLPAILPRSELCFFMDSPMLIGNVAGARMPTVCFCCRSAWLARMDMQYCGGSSPCMIQLLLSRKLWRSARSGLSHASAIYQAASLY